MGSSYESIDQVNKKIVEKLLIRDDPKNQEAPKEQSKGKNAENESKRLITKNELL